MHITSEERKQALYRQSLGLKPTKGDQRKVAIIEAVIEGLGTGGFESITFESIGKRSRMRPSHVAYYYPNIDDAVEAATKFIVATAQQTTVEFVREALTYREKLNAFIEGTFAWVERNPNHFSVMLVLWYYSTHDRKYRKFHDEIRELGATRLEAIIDPVLKKGKRKRGFSARTIAKSIQSILTGHLIEFYTTNSKRPLGDLRRDVLQLAAYLVD